MTFAAWNAAERKVRVSLGDWAKTSTGMLKERLARILGDARVEVCDECGFPDGPGWEKIAAAAAADVVAAIRRTIKDLPPLMPGYGDVFYNPEEHRIYFVSGDSDGREVTEPWREALLKIRGIDEVRHDAEHYPDGIGTGVRAVPPWIKVARLKAPGPRAQTHVFTVAVDLDGTLYKYDTWKGEDHFGTLRRGALKALREFQRRGWRVIIFTTRGNTARVKQQLHADDVPFDYINENPDQPAGTSAKVIADVYLDDRAVDASVAWDRVVAAVERRFQKAAAAWFRPGPGLTRALTSAAGRTGDLIQGATRRVGAAGQALAGQAGKTLRFATGVPEGQSVAPTFRQGVGNVTRALVRPQYRGFDRPPDVTSLARPLDRTRAFMGTAARNANVAAMGLSGAALGHSLLKTYPEFVGDHIAGVTGQPNRDYDATLARAREAAPGVYAELGKQFAGVGATDPLSRLVGNVARQTAVPYVRHDLYQARQSRPWLMGTIDTLRSLTPAGLLATIGLRQLGSAQPADIGASVREHLPEYLGQAARAPGEAFTGPFAEAARHVVPDTTALAQGRPRKSLAVLGWELGLPWSRMQSVDHGGPQSPFLNPTYGQAGQGIQTADRAARAARLLGSLLPDRDQGR
jgi:hypothetical protein